MQVYKLLYMVKITLAMKKKKMEPNQSMLTVHNFITRPLQLMKQGKEPRVRLTHTSDQYVARQAEKVSVSQTTGVGVREAVTQCTTDSEYTIIPKVRFKVWANNCSDGTQVCYFSWESWPL